MRAAPTGNTRRANELRAAQHGIAKSDHVGTISALARPYWQVTV